MGETRAITMDTGGAGLCGKSSLTEKTTEAETTIVMTTMTTVPAAESYTESKKISTKNIETVFA